MWGDISDFELKSFELSPWQQLGSCYNTYNNTTLALKDYINTNHSYSYFASAITYSPLQDTQSQWENKKSEGHLTWQNTDILTLCLGKCRENVYMCIYDYII